MRFTVNLDHTLMQEYLPISAPSLFSACNVLNTVNLPTTFLSGDIFLINIKDSPETADTLLISHSFAWLNTIECRDVKTCKNTSIARGNIWEDCEYFRITNKFVVAHTHHYNHLSSITFDAGKLDVIYLYTTYNQ